MSRGYHKTIVVGRLGRDPEVKVTQSGKSVANFTVAVNQKIGEAEKTTWYPITAWETLADNCNKYLRKGSWALIEGEMDFRSYEKDGVQKTAHSLVARNVVFLGDKPEAGSEYTAKSNDNQPAPKAPTEDFDIPF